MMKYRKSNYLIEVPTKDGITWISSLTGAIDVVSQDVEKKVEDKNIDKDLETYLVYRGHLTKMSKSQETSFALKVWSAMDKQQRGKGNIIICPSMDCNFRCTYCFERPLQDRIDSGTLPKRSLNMTTAQVDKIFSSFPAIKEINDEISSHITLFGGEPLWSKNYDVIKYIVERASSKGFTLSAITNGYELSAFRDLLGEKKVEMIQVSLDGIGQQHDDMRPTFSGEKTFDKIIREIQSVIDIKGLTINIRMNYDYDNMSSAPELVEFLTEKGILGRKGVNFHGNLISMNHIGEGKAYKTLKNYSTVSSKLNEFELDCYTTSLKKSLEKAITKNEPMVRKSHFCAATYGMYVFCPDDKIYACWEGVGEEHSYIGRYSPEIQWDEKGLIQWHRRNVLAIPQCQSCSHLFLCGGGCAIHAYERAGEFNISECDGLKNKFKYMVNSYLDSAGQTTDRRSLPVLSSGI